MQEFPSKGVHEHDTRQKTKLLQKVHWTLAPKLKSCETIFPQYPFSPNIE